LRSEWNSPIIMWKTPVRSDGDPEWNELDQNRFADCGRAISTFKSVWYACYYHHYDSGMMYGDHLTAVDHDRGGYLELEGSEGALLIKFYYSESILYVPCL
jgi:hypothetical protein